MTLDPVVVAHADFAAVSDFFVVGSRIVTPDGEGPRAVGIRGGKIVSVGPRESVPAGAPVIDAGDRVVLPGLVDTHVHINDPGREAWEGFDTATRAAARGGVTTLVDMPLNSIPSTVSLEALSAKVRAMEGRAFVDVGLCGGVVPGNAGALGELFREGVLAFKCFLAESGVNEFSHVNEAELRLAMEILAGVGAPLLVHAELPGPLSAAEGALKGDPRAYATYLASRPRTAEDAAVDLVMRLSRDTRARAHIVHLSSADALDTVRAAHESGVNLSVETCPHYLTFAAEDIPEGATEYKCAPPIRERENQDRLWDALREGLLDQIVTDHSPSTVELKCSGSGDFMKAWGGISSLQIGLAAVWTEGRPRGLGPSHLARLMSEAPARLAGLSDRKGAIAVGRDADLAFFDPEGTFSVSAASLEHRNKITPYEGRSLQGRVVRTMLRGETIFEDGPGLAARPRGAWIRRT